MRLGEVRVAEDRDFEEFVSLADKHDGWKLDFFSSSTKVWTRDSDFEDCKMIKVSTSYLNVDAATAYDVLHDSEYRPQWDKGMMAIQSIGCLNPNNEICYYASSCPPPLRNRDMVLQRSWLETPSEYYVIAHSVTHRQYPPRKGFVRALSYLSGYVVRPLSPQGCQVRYVAHASFGGHVPAWLINKVSQIMVPRLVKRLHKACVGYPSWKKQHNPHFKPWIYPEQMPTARIDAALCSKNPLDEREATVDESEMQESDFIASDINGEED